MIKIIAVSLLLSLFSPVLAQDVNSLKSYQTIKVFSDGKEIVEAKLGKGFIGSNEYFVTYNLKQMYVSVSYSFGGCDSTFPEWDLVDWTVTQVSYTPRGKGPSLERLLKGSGNKFKMRQNGDVLNHIEYFDETRGISVVFDKSTKEVMEITLGPSSAQIRRFACNK